MKALCREEVEKTEIKIIDRELVNYVFKLVIWQEITVLSDNANLFVVKEKILLTIYSIELLNGSLIKGTAIWG